ncbi:MAG: SLC13 family permease [Chloroflexota bacterium]
MSRPTGMNRAGLRSAPGQPSRLGGALRGAVAALGGGLALLCWLGVVGGELPLPARQCLGVTCLAVGLWGSELVAMPVTAVLAMFLLYVGGVVPTLQQALVGFASPVLFFLLGSFALGIAAEQTGLSERLARWLLARSRGSGRRLLRDLLISLPLQAILVPSAMSRNTVLVPIYARVLARLGHPPRLGAGVMLALGVLGPLASTMFLSGGTSPVAAAAALGGFNWVSWFVAVAPPYYVLLAIGSLALWLLCPPEDTVKVAAVPEGEGPSRRFSAAEWRVAAVGLGTSLLWMLDQWTGWPPAVPALLALLVLLWPRLGVMGWSTFARQAPWSTCFVLAGAVSLAEALAGSGAAAWVANGLFAWFPLPDGPVGAALVIYAVTCAIALAVPNRAAAITLVIPLAAAYAAGGHLPVAAAGLVVLIAVDLETIYPAQTAANLIAYDRGYFGAGLLARFNLLTLAAGALVVALLALPWWNLVGLPR